MGRRETETRQQILDSCVALIEQAGGRRLRVKEIAEAANVAIPTIYYYFDDRETLLAEAHTVRLLEIFSELDGDRSRTVEAVEAVDQDGYVEAVAAVREPYWDPVKRETVWRYVEALTELHRDPVVFDRVAKVIEVLLRRRVRTGVLGHVPEHRHHVSVELRRRLDPWHHRRPGSGQGQSHHGLSGATTIGRRRPGDVSMVGITRVDLTRRRTPVDHQSLEASPWSTATSVVPGSRSAR